MRLMAFLVKKGLSAYYHLGDQTLPTAQAIVPHSIQGSPAEQ